MTFFMIGGFISIAVSVILLVVFFLARGGDDNSRSSKIVMWMAMLFGVAGASLLTIEYSFPQISHPEETTMIYKINDAVRNKFIETHPDNRIIDIKTQNTPEYYVSDVFYVDDPYIKVQCYHVTINSNNEFTITEAMY